jgi:hypothetical protein
MTFVFWYSFIYSGIIYFVYFIYTEPKSSIPATHKSAEEEYADELHEGQAKPRGQGGKTGTGWVQKYQESGSKAELNSRVREILNDLQEELGVSHHPYKRVKRASPEISRSTDFWHVQQSRKYGATLSCPFRCTTECPFKIKYTIKKATLRVLVMSEHDHSNDQCIRGLSIDKTIKVHEAAQRIPTSKSKFFSIQHFQILTFKFCTVVKPRALHIELNDYGDVHISPTKKNVRAVRYLVNRTRKEKTNEAMGGRAGTFDGFKELMESILLGSLVENHNTDSEKHHLSMDSMVCIVLHVQEESNIYVAVVTTQSLLLNPIRAMQHIMEMDSD